MPLSSPRVWSKQKYLVQFSQRHESHPLWFLSLFWVLQERRCYNTHVLASKIPKDLPMSLGLRTCLCDPRTVIRHVCRCESSGRLEIQSRKEHDFELATRTFYVFEHDLKMFKAPQVFAFFFPSILDSLAGSSFLSTWFSLKNEFATGRWSLCLPRVLQKLEHPHSMSFSALLVSSQMSRRSALYAFSHRLCFLSENLSRMRLCCFRPSALQESQR